jgi:hypothetical protein
MTSENVSHSIWIRNFNLLIFLDVYSDDLALKTDCVLNSLDITLLHQTQLKPTSDVLERIASLISKHRTNLHTIRLCGLRAAKYTGLGRAMASCSLLNTVSFRDSIIGDTEFTSLAAHLGQTHVNHLCLAHCGLTSTSARTIASLLSVRLLQNQSL